MLGHCITYIEIITQIYIEKTEQNLFNLFNLDIIYIEYYKSAMNNTDLTFYPGTIKIT